MKKPAKAPKKRQADKPAAPPPVRSHALRRSEFDEGGKMLAQQQAAEQNKADE